MGWWNWYVLDKFNLERLRRSFHNTLLDSISPFQCTFCITSRGPARQAEHHHHSFICSFISKLHNNIHIPISPCYYHWIRIEFDSFCAIRKTQSKKREMKCVNLGGNIRCWKLGWMEAGASSLPKNHFIRDMV